MLARYHVDAAGTQQRTILLRNEHSDAVHTGRDAYNWLTVIVRGDEYLCFVRDHPVGMYHDTAGLTPRQGHLGIWLGGDHTEGAYYYFSVYPAA